MKKHQTLSIKIPNNAMDEYIDSLYRVAKEHGYKRLEDIENKLREDKTLDFEYVCLETPRIHVEGQYLSATIWLSIEENKLILRNIISKQRSFLSTEEYNQIVNLFLSNILKQVGLKGVRHFLSKPDYQLSDGMGAKTAEALRNFSNAANKTSKLTNEGDMMLWGKFIGLASRTHATISTEYLEKWLLEEGWMPECAQYLAEQYEYSASLLKYV